MRRQSRAGGKSLKARRRKAATPTRRKAPKALRRRSTVAAGNGTKTAQLARERNEALEQLSAASEVLNVINSSPGDLQAVFAVILASATHICQANFGTLYRFDGEKLHFAAEVGAPRDLAEFYKQREPHLPPPGSHIERVVRTKRPSQTADYTADAVPGPAAKFARAGSTVWVPMLKNDLLVGVILVYRQEIRLFTDRQIALLRNFAAQAVTAIENARLLNELRESLEQQTATADVLSVISKSPSDLERVFQSILENATRLCEARFGNIFQFVGNAFHFAARVDTPRKLAEFQKRRGPFLPVEGGSMDRMMRTKQVVHVVDNAAETVPTPAARLGGARSTVDVPMIKDGALVGAIAVYRQEVRPFTDKQIALVQNFAAQAVIAIENARLLKELRQRTTDLTESLQQQTATADVLRIISSSPGDLGPVFQTMLENATRICEAKFGILYRFDGEAFHFAADVGTPREFAEFLRRRGPFQPPPGTNVDLLLRTKDVVRIADDSAGPAPGAAARFAGARSLVSVPMLKENVLIGAITIFRQEVRPFTDKQIELVKNFAAQAVIAIENTRLLNELHQRTDDLTESLDQQTATSEVLKVISSSPGELEPVFQAMLMNATRICESKFGTMYLREGDAFRTVEIYGAPPAYVEERMHEPLFQPGPGTGLARAAKTKQVVHIPDVTVERAYTERDPLRTANVKQGVRAILAVPMLKDSELVGVIAIYRTEVRPFTDKQIDLVTNFAAQAVIAIENTRLLKELRQRTNDLSVSLENLRTAQDRLVQTEKLASLGQLTAGIAHEIKNPLNFVNNFSSVSVELIDELQDTLGAVKADDKTRTEIAELTDTLRGNLEKVVQHGKRADAIVKNMLLHSRQGSGEHRPVDINALVEEGLNLAYHGARAEKQGFTITLERSFDPAAGEVDVFPQEITRVLLNLISNGFYAATKRQGQADSDDHEPTLTAATRNLGDKVEIKIRDNGTGIPPEVKEKIFNPFFTTKPAGEGTGLGLSISHDIIVKQHSGSIEVETEPGAFTEFRIVLPRTAA